MNIDNLDNIRLHDVNKLYQSYLNKSLEVIKPKIDKEIYEYMGEHYNYADCDSYESPFRMQYSLDLFPFYKQIQEDIKDVNKKEIYLLKPSRAGGSENLIFTPLRYLILNDPCDMLYVTADIMSCKNTMSARIMGGMQGCQELNIKYEEADKSVNEIRFDNMRLVVAHNKLRSAFKSSGYKYIFLDELSTFSSEILSMALKRTGCYKDGKIIGISSPDPRNRVASSDDAMFQMFKKGNQCEWEMPDPSNGKYFKFELSGLKWDENSKNDDGTWDYNKIKNNAYYLTPYGTKIYDKDRIECISKGKWVAGNINNDYTISSYHLNAFHMPFPSSSFGNIAVNFLQHKKNKNSFRVFVYEYLAEEWIQEAEVVNDKQLIRNMRHYNVGEDPTVGNVIINNTGMEDKRIEINDNDITFESYYKTHASINVIGVDVQKNTFYYTVSKIWDTGDIAILDYGEVIEYQLIEDKANKYNVERVVMDYGYELRRGEVFGLANQYKLIPLMGRDKLQLPYLERLIDPLEGKRGGGKEENRVLTYEFNSNMYQNILFNMLNGNCKQKLYLPINTTKTFQNQLNSFIYSDGEFIHAKGRQDDHYNDCVKMTLVYANILNYYVFGN